MIVNLKEHKDSKWWKEHSYSWVLCEISKLKETPEYDAILDKTLETKIYDLILYLEKKND